MIYEEHLRAAETGSWSLEGIRWSEIDRATALGERDILSALHDAALIEGYLPVFAPRLMRLLWDDVDATAILSLEMYEGLRHYTALKRYLDAVGYSPAKVSEASLVTARARAIDIEYREEEIVTYLTHFMCSELFAAHFFRRLSEQTCEPVLKELLQYMSRDEHRHSAGAGALLKKRIDADPSLGEEVLAAAENFRHYGSDVVDVPVAEENDFEAVMAMNRKVRQLCGLAPTEHIKEELTHG
jgi:rubrerythrin